ncbi:zinc finger protein [Xylariaceae sp. FL1651]|nr:zinc finger protein [Xylariaceae sp. FL1651]
MGVGNKRTLTKTRRKTRDLDQIKADLVSPQHLSQYKDTKLKEDLPGLGRWYCVECAKWYDTEINLVLHRKGKPHKRRVKQLREEPYTQKEAEAAVGLGTSNDSSQHSDKPTDNEVEMAT